MELLMKIDRNILNDLPLALRDPGGLLDVVRPRRSRIR